MNKTEIYILNFFFSKNENLCFFLTENKKITKIGLELTFLEHFEIRPDFRDFRFFGKIGPPTRKGQKNAIF